MPRKNLKGRPSRIYNVKAKVRQMRENGLSYTEIGMHLGISKQLARYHDLWITPIDKEMEKN